MIAIARLRKQPLHSTTQGLLVIRFGDRVHMVALQREVYDSHGHRTCRAALHERTNNGRYPVAPQRRRALNPAHGHVKRHVRTVPIPTFVADTRSRLPIAISSKLPGGLAPGPSPLSAPLLREIERKLHFFFPPHSPHPITLEETRQLNSALRKFDSSGGASLHDRPRA